MSKIYIISGPMEGHDFDLKNGTTSVGRAPDNDIQINDHSISRKHVKIIKKGNKFFVEDLKSQNGTWIDGNLIGPGNQCEVEKGVLITIGKISFSLGEIPSKNGTVTHYSINLSGEAGEKRKDLLYKDRRITDRKRLELIYEVSTILMQSLEINEIADRIMSSLFRGLKRIDSGAVLLIDDNTGELKEIVCKARDNRKDIQIHYSRTIVNRVMREGKAILMSDTSREDKYDLSNSIAMMSIKSIMCAPLICKSHILGVIYAHSVNVVQGFLKDDLFLLTALSSPAALAIENALLYSRRKQTEKALRESEERYRLLAETAKEIILTFDLDGRVTYANKAWSEKSGYTQAETLGKGVEDLVPGDELRGLKERLAEREPSEKEPALYEADFLDKRGNRISLEITSSPLIKHDKPSGLLLTARDIRERKEMEKERLRIQKLESIGTLAAGIAHDFNNILTGILINVDLAQMDLDPQDKKYNNLSDAKKACMNAKDLTRQFITFSKGGAPMKRTGSIIETVKDSVNLALAGSDVTWKCSLPDDLWLVEFDESQIRQAIHQLVTNAKEAMPKGGTIKVQGENVTISLDNREKKMGLRHVKNVKISIQDQGVGIPEEHLPEIFDPYFSTKEAGRQKGMGLGLTTTFSIIKRHDGHITVESELGTGTTIHIYLPASKKESPEKKVKGKSLPVKGKVLVMDDDDMIRDTTAQVLNNLGHDVSLSKDGREAIDLYQRAMEAGEPFDAVILDLTIRAGMGGKEALKRLLEIDREVKAIVSSGYLDDPIITNFSQHGFSDAIAKPYNIKRLKEAIDKILREKI